MRAFIVEKGTVVLVIKDGREWSALNITDYETTKESMFFVEDIVVDPTGISETACVPGCVTIGSLYAERGYYGFRRGGWTMLVPANEVTVR